MSVSSLRPRYGFHNFFISTVANYSLCEIPDRPPDFWSPSGSVYWNCGDSVKRCSDHWGPNIASCRWFLDFESMSTSYALCGDCLYEDFRPTWVLENDVMYGRASRLATAPRSKRDEDKTLRSSTLLSSA